VDRKHKVGLGLQVRKRGRNIRKRRTGHSVRDHRRKKADGKRGKHEARLRRVRTGYNARDSTEAGHTKSPSRQKEPKKPYVYISQSYTTASEYNPHLSSPATRVYHVSPPQRSGPPIHELPRHAGGGRDGVPREAISQSCCLPSSFVCAVLSVSRRS